VRYAHIPVLDLHDGKKAFDAILKESKIAIEHEGAEVIVLGCTGMSPLTARLQRSLGVPVIDPAVASLKLAEIYVTSGLTSSKIAYGSSPEKKII